MQRFFASILDLLIVISLLLSAATLFFWAGSYGRREGVTDIRPRSENGQIKWQVSSTNGRIVFGYDRVTPNTLSGRVREIQFSIHSRQLTKRQLTLINFASALESKKPWLQRLGISFDRWQFDYNLASRLTVTVAFRDDDPDDGWGDAIFCNASDFPVSGDGSFSMTKLTTPYWLIAILLATPSLISMRRKWKTHRRRAKGLCLVCLVCGYDLRATPNRCPECGAITRPQHKLV